MIGQAARRRKAGTEPVVLSTRGGLTVTVMPSRGARIGQITDTLGTNWLADTGAGELPDGAPVEFANGSRGGWDECMPSVSGCPDPNRVGADIADHGDFWATPWAVESLDEGAVALTTGRADHPLQVRKTVSLPAGRESLRVDLEVLNRSGSPYRFLYSAHPLWAFSNDAMIDVPGASEMSTAFGPGWPQRTAGSWPMAPAANSGRQDISRIPYRGDRTNYKVFVRWSGEARLTVPALESAVVLRQSPAITPWLGICVNRGAYPSTLDGDHWIAIEPTTAPTDSLVTAIESGWERTLEPGRVVAWTTNIEIVHGVRSRL